MLNKFLPLCRPEFTPTIFGELCHFLMQVAEGSRVVKLALATEIVDYIHNMITYWYFQNVSIDATEEVIPVNKIIANLGADIKSRKKLKIDFDNEITVEIQYENSVEEVKKPVPKQIVYECNLCGQCTLYSSPQIKGIAIFDGGCLNKACLPTQIVEYCKQGTSSFNGTAFIELFTPQVESVSVGPQIPEPTEAQLAKLLSLLLCVEHTLEEEGDDDDDEAEDQASGYDTIMDEGMTSDDD